MTFFMQEDHTSLQPGTGSHAAQHKLMQLHRALYERMRISGWDLHPHPVKQQIVRARSATTRSHSPALTLTYLRSADQAQLVEHLMGIDQGRDSQAIDTERHPVIELRLTPNAFTVELVLAPVAWWDQQNLIGKLELERHASAFQRILHSAGADFRFGFWEGTELSEMHLNTWQLTQPGIFAEWMDTFADGQDWFRFGTWYAPEDPALAAEHIVGTLYDRVSTLYTIYDFLLWTGNNNFHSFYEKRQRHLRRLYA